MNDLLLSNFSFAKSDTNIVIRDEKSFELATAAQQAADGIIAGFNTQFEQKSGEYVSPFFCLRNKTVYVEFPNLNTEKDIPDSIWVTVCYIRTKNLPLSTVYRDIIIGGVPVIVELNTNGQMRMYSQKKIPAQTPILGGFSYLI